MNIELITTVLTFFFGGTSIYQFLFYRNEKRKKEAEAAALEIENKSKLQELQQNESDYSFGQMKKVSEELNRLQNDYIILYQQVQTHLKTIAVLQEQINSLSLENSYLKGLRCYQTDCPIRKKKRDDNSSTTQSDMPDSNNVEHKPGVETA